MSSSRANAAARQRRAGGAELNSTQPQQKMQGQPQPGKQPQTTKLSISDAIALITLRLGKVEGIVSNYQSDQLQVQVDQNGQPIQNAKMIDDSVFKSIVSRLDVLEKNQKVLMENQTSIANTVKSLATSKQQGAGQTIIKDVSDEKLGQVNESVELLKEEIRQSNNTVFNLQSFVQELSQKMVELILTSDGTTMIDGEQSVQFANEEGTQEEGMNGETVGEDLEGGEDSGPILELNMKEFIQSELASSSDL